MNVVRSTGEPTLVYVLLSDSEITLLRQALKKSKNTLAQDLRRRLKRA